eukprot:3542858-Amphidinium_carterae.1
MDSEDRVQVFLALRGDYWCSNAVQVWDFLLGRGSPVGCKVELSPFPGHLRVTHKTLGLSAKEFEGFCAQQYCAFEALALSEIIQIADFKANGNLLRGSVRLLERKRKPSAGTSIWSRYLRQAQGSVRCWREIPELLAPVYSASGFSLVTSDGMPGLYSLGTMQDNAPLRMTVENQRVTQFFTNSSRDTVASRCPLVVFHYFGEPYCLWMRSCRCYSFGGRCSGFPSLDLGEFEADMERRGRRAIYHGEERHICSQRSIPFL